MLLMLWWLFTKMGLSVDSRWDCLKQPYINHLYLNKPVYQQNILTKILIMSEQKLNNKLSNWIQRPAQPIMMDSFDGDMEKAVMFYCAEVDRLFLANYLLSTQLKATLDEKKELKQKIQVMKKNLRDRSREERKIRHRRCADQISRGFECSAQRCGRSYGTEASLGQHIKIKHPQLLASAKEVKKQQKQQKLIKLIKIRSPKEQKIKFEDQQQIGYQSQQRKQNNDLVESPQNE